MLLSSESFQKVTGGGVTFTNLFANWPKENIASIHLDPLPLDSDICSNYYLLTEKEIFPWGVFKLFTKTLYTTYKKNSDKLNSQNFFLRILRFFKKILFGDSIPKNVRLTPELFDWIKGFRPTILYSTLGSNHMMELTECLRLQFHLPLVVHIMDDWVSVPYRGGLLSSWQNKKRDRLLRHMLEVATLRFSICDEMSEAYGHRYGKIFESFQNVIDISAWQQFRKPPNLVGSPVRVAYIGSIFPNAQLISICDVSRAVQEISDEGFSMTFEIYSPNHHTELYRKQLVAGKSVSLSDTIQDDKVFFSILQAVDILIIPVNFDEDSIRFIRYSMPTKVPAYLSAGTPILVYGPPDVAQIAYADKAGWALTVVEPDHEKLKQSLIMLATNMTLRERVSRCALIAAEQKHDANRIRPVFHSALTMASTHFANSIYAKQL
jgi:glycosyltransferase involved in cell wall biosynthesis